MSQPYKNDDKKILLLASNEDDLDFMQNALVTVKPNLKGRIVRESDCENAVKELATSDFPIQFIRPQKEGGGCIAQYIYHFLRKNSNSHGLKVVLVENFDITVLSPETLIVFEYNERFVKIRADHCTSKKNMKRIVHTLFDVPPVYISYGNDKDTKVLLPEIVKKFRSLFPHIEIKYDKKDLRYKESINSYIENLKKGNNIILLINKRYLKSIDAMDEFISILNKTNNIYELKAKIYPIVMESGECIYDPVKMQAVLDFWNQERSGVLVAMQLGTNTALSAKLNLIEQIITLLPEFACIIQDFYSLGLETYRESKFFDLFWEINRQLTDDGFESFYSNEGEMKKALCLTD